MVKWKTKFADGENCGSCKIFVEGFCDKWAFPVDADHSPCVKYKSVKRAQVKLGAHDLFLDLLNKLNTLQNVAKDYSNEEIVNALDMLIKKYKKDFLDLAKG